MVIKTENKYIVEETAYGTEVVLGFVCNKEKISRLGTVVYFKGEGLFQIEAPSDSDHPLRMIGLNESTESRIHYVRPDVFETLVANEIISFKNKSNLT